MKATEKHQVNRFRDADEMLEALRNVDRLTGGFVDPAMAGAFRSVGAGGVDSVYADEGVSGGYRNGNGNGNGDVYRNGGEGGYDGGYEGDGYDGGDYGASIAGDEYADEADPLETGTYGAAGSGMESYYDEDDEDDMRARKAKSYKNTKRRDENRKYKVLAVIAAIAAAALVVFALYQTGVLDRLMNGAPDEKTVEDVIGFTVEDATEALKAQGYEVAIGEDVFDDNVEVGRVARQTPAAREALEEGGVVTLQLSKGPEQPGEDTDDTTDEEVTAEMGVVPDLVGKDQSVAEDVIRASGFEPGEITKKDDEKPVGQVIGQSPKAGDELEKGSKIDLTISLGPKAKEVKMPNLIGLTEKKALSELKKADLTPGKIDREYSDAYKKGTVMWQQYAKGEKLSAGQVVNIIICRGPQDKTSTVSIDIDYTKARADTFFLTVILEDKDGNETYIRDGEQCLKASGGQSVSVKGTGAGCRVIIYFDDEIVRTCKVDFNTGTVTG
jgi:serine/threonine-protein kinase